VTRRCLSLIPYSSFDSGTSETIQWEKIKPPTDEVVVPYDNLAEFSDGNNLDYLATTLILNTTLCSWKIMKSIYFYVKFLLLVHSKYGSPGSIRFLMLTFDDQPHHEALVVS
jgi:hypothetical protein